MSEVRLFFLKNRFSKYYFYNCSIGSYFFFHFKIIVTLKVIVRQFFILDNIINNTNCNCKFKINKIPVTQVHRVAKSCVFLPPPPPAPFPAKPLYK